MDTDDSPGVAERDSEVDEQDMPIGDGYETRDDAENSKTIARTAGGIGVGVVTCVAAAVFIALLVVFLVYQADADDESHDARHQRDIHRSEVELAITNTAGSGLPWYEVMDVPPECLTPRILRWEVKHGFRPSS